MLAQAFAIMPAHAFGKRYDSPVPLSLFVLGGAVVVLLSFAMVYRREVAAPASTPSGPDVVAPGGGVVPGTVAVIVLVLLILAGLLGSQSVPENIVPTAFWLVAWVAVPLAVGLIGDFSAAVNPFSVLARAAGSARIRRVVLGRRTPLPWPRRLGYWPSVVVYIVVVIGELVVNGVATLPRVTAAGLIGYALICLAGGLVFGADAWNTRGEMFTVMLASWGRLGWWRWRAPGRRGFAGGLDVPFDASVSRLVGVLLLLVSVSFDGLLSTPQWIRFAAGLPARLAPGTTGGQLVSSLTLLVLTTVMLAVFGGFAASAARAGRHGGSATVALTGLIPSLLPIAYAYLLAHYLQYVAINGQLLLPLIGNPVGLDSWPIHLPYPFNDSYEVNTSVMPTSVVWYVQIVVIIGAHIIAVVLAHRHLAVSSAEPALARRSEWPWLAAMVGYTMLSLWLLAQPVLAESSGAKAALGVPAAARTWTGL